MPHDFQSRRLWLALTLGCALAILFVSLASPSPRHEAPAPGWSHAAAL